MISNTLVQGISMHSDLSRRLKYNMNREGVESYTFPNKFFEYQGEWKLGRKNGYGKFIMRDGSVYEGEFVNDEMQGIGRYYNARTGDQYEGDFIMGEKSGKGVMKYSDGSVYEGEWDSNKRQGKLCEASGVIYEGEFYKNKKHGEGIENYEDGSRYIGYWVAGNRHGHGRLNYHDGSSYEGQWKNGSRHGIGVLNHISGFRFEGLWHCDSPTWMASKMCLAVGVDVGKFNYMKEFSLTVECFDDDNRVCNLDNGRTIEVFAGKLLTTDLKDSSSNLSSSEEEADGYELKEFALNCFNINITPIHVMRATLTLQEPSEKEPDFESHSQESMQSEGEDEEEQDEVSLSINESSASKIQQKDEEKVENITYKNVSSHELLNNSSGVSTKEFYSAFHCIARTNCGRIAFDRLLISDAKGTADKTEQSLHQNLSAQNIPDGSFEDTVNTDGALMHEANELVDKDINRIVFIARDVTTPPFMGSHLSPCYVLVEVESEPSKDAFEEQDSLVQ